MSELRKASSHELRHDASSQHAGGDAADRPQRPGAADALNESIIANIHHALVVLDSAQRIIRCNQHFLDVFRLTPEAVASRPVITDVVPNERLDAIVRQGLVSDETVREIEFSCAIGDGEERQFLMGISRLQRPVQGLLVTFDEITEWKRRQLQVMEAGRLVSVGEMAAGIAHEINNPLAAVMGFAQLVLQRDLEPSVRQDLEKILAEAKRASKIVANLQSFARRHKPRKQYTDLVGTLRKILEFRSYEFRVNNIQASLNVADDVPSTMADEHQMEQVFLNIITNAEQFMSDAHGGGRLTVAVARAEDRLRISFTDNGPGIAPEHLSKIFDPFFTTKDVGRGTGLGLSICYGIVHEHGGTIRAESKPGQGATFTIELPIIAPPSGQENGVPAAGAPRRLRALVVDDEPAVSELLARFLAEDGHAVDVATSGDEVINRRDLSKYDVILLDVKMPGIKGTQLFDYIRQLPGNVASRVLFVTGDTTDMATQDFIAQAGSPMLAKPFTLEDLRASVQRIAR